MQVWPPKDPDEVLDYTTTWVLPGTDTVASSAFTVEAGSVEIEQQSLEGNVAKVRLSGGVIGEVCEVLNRITSSTGEIYDSTQKLRIRKK